MSNTETPSSTGKSGESPPPSRSEPIASDFEYLSKNFNGALLSFMMNLFPGEDGYELKSLVLDNATGWRTTNRVLHTDGFAAENAYDQTLGEIEGRMTAEAMRSGWIPKFMEEVELTLDKYSDHSELSAHLVDLLEFVRSWEPKGIRFSFLDSPVIELSVVQSGSMLQRSIRVIQRRVQERIRQILDERFERKSAQSKLRWVKGVDLFGHLMRRLVDKGYIAPPATKLRKGKVELNAKVFSDILMEHFEVEYESGKTAKATNVYQQVKDAGNNTDSDTIKQLQDDLAASAL